MISDYNQSTETITDTFMVDVSSVFGKTELKLSQQESNFWYPQTWWIDSLTNLKLFWPKQLIPIQIILETNCIFIIYYFLILYKMCTGESTKLIPTNLKKSWQSTIIGIMNLLDESKAFSYK